MRGINTFDLAARSHERKRAGQRGRAVAQNAARWPSRRAAPATPRTHLLLVLVLVLVLLLLPHHPLASFVVVGQLLQLDYGASRLAAAP